MDPLPSYLTCQLVDRALDIEWHKSMKSCTWKTVTSQKGRNKFQRGSTVNEIDMYKTLSLCFLKMTT